MTRLIIERNTVVGIEAESLITSRSSLLSFSGPVILATGHSARDVYRYLHGNGNDQIKFIMLDAPCDHSLYGLRVGMDKSVLDEYCRNYLYHTYYDDGENYFFTLSMQPDGYTETLWVVEKGGRLTHVIYEVGYGHD